MSLAIFVMFQSFGTMVFQLEKSMLATNQNTCAVENQIEDNDGYLWENFQFKLEAFKKFGCYGFYTKILLDLVFGMESISSEKQKNFVEEINSGIVNANFNAPLHDDNLVVVLCESLEWFVIDPFNDWIKDVDYVNELVDEIIPDDGRKFLSYIASKVALQ